MITSEKAAKQPLLTQAQIIDRISDIVIEPINPRQLWILIIDEHGYQLPVCIPISGIPTHPEPNPLHGMMIRLADTFAGTGAAQAIFVLERLGPPGITQEDRLWAAALRRTASVSRLKVRGVYLCNPMGVREIPAS